MPVEFSIPGPLRPFAEDRGRLTLPGAPGTVGEALKELWSVFPGLKDRIVTEQGEVRPHVNVFLGPDNVRDLDGFQTPLPAACEITILPAVSGG